MKKVLIVLFFLVLSVTICWLWRSKVTDNTTAFIYELPFAKGESYTVVQGYGGLFSHKNIAALDFYMPVGTPIYAARAGTIFSFKDDSQHGGPLPAYKKQANFIIIKHTDGSFGCYWHLQHHGVVAKSGFVQQGQLIGYSGSTGFVLSPHLHFSVKAVLNYSMDAYLKTKFNTTIGAQLKN